jgi:hypothetical protein
MMNKKQKQILNATLDKALAPPKKRTHLDELLDEYDDKLAISASRPTSPHPTSPHLTPPQVENKSAAKEITKPAQQRGPIVKVKQPTAPVRDFNRRANSIDRDALPSGLFPGVSKKLYDALYLRTRGAVQPTRSIRATKKQLQQWSGIGSQNTLDAHLRHFIGIGLLIRSFEVGDNSGAIYEVLIPEEIGAISPQVNQPHLTPPHPTSPHLTSDQKMGGGSPQKMGGGGVGQVIDGATISESAHTSSNTIHDDDDDGVSLLVEMIRQAGREILGGELPKNKQERERWRELAGVLVEELKQAGGRVNSVSSVPAFFAVHLRRRFKTGQGSPKEARLDSQLTKSQATALSKEQRILKMIKELTLLHVGDPDYSEQDLIDDLKFRCERDQISWNEEMVKNLLSRKQEQKT